MDMGWGALPEQILWSSESWLGKEQSEGYCFRFKALHMQQRAAQKAVPAQHHDQKKPQSIGLY